VSLDFVSDVWIRCNECEGLRYQPTVLQCTIDGENINDVLEMTVQQAGDFFSFDKKIHNALALLAEVGLGYLKLGQSTSTMSGGELQRLKLAKELMHPAQGQRLYLMDEPTTGLNFSDVAQLLRLFRKLVEQGNTMLIIEHNQDVMRQCDWLITLGPEGGESGGYLLDVGQPASGV
jgi:excinuclease ABC subunit A